MHESKLSIEQSGEVVFVRFVDEDLVDEVEIRQAAGELLEAVEAAPVPKMLIDFEGLTHLSSSVIGVLVSVSNKIRAKDGQLRLANVGPLIREVFEITRLDKMFTICGTAQEAMSSFS